VTGARAALAGLLLAAFALLPAACAKPDDVLARKGYSLDDEGFVSAAADLDAEAVDAFLTLGHDPNRSVSPRWNGATPLSMVAYTNAACSKRAPTPILPTTTERPRCIRPHSSAFRPWPNC
jgi:hypothetical protein